MAQLAISREFLAEFAKLEKSAQKATSEAIAKFESASTRSGLHLEPVTNARDPRVKTIRINQSLRGVVLAPESGDLHILLTVRNHDAAYAYASSRKITINQALGVLEVRNEAGLETLAPALEEVSRLSDQRPTFSGIADKDLVGLGVDAALLPLVRTITDETQLQVLGQLIPEPQYVALLALASGDSMERAWAEVQSCAPDAAARTPAEPENVASALRRTPGEFVMVKGPEELGSILDHPFDAWRVFLHPAQRRLADRAYSGPVQITGGAGTGKTVTALHRAAELARKEAQRLDSTEGPAVLFTTFTTYLAETLRGQLARLITDPELLGRIEILNVDKLANRVVRGAVGHAVSVINDAELRKRWDEAARTDGLPYSGTFLAAEWEQVILAQGITSEAAYLACRRTGRGEQLGGIQRRQVWAALQRYTSRLRAEDRWTHLQIAQEAAELLEENGDTPYRHVIVDEAQDLHPAQWRLLRRTVAHAADDLFIVGDPHQRIYGDHVSLAALGVHVRGRSHKLRINYRTTQEILLWAVPILGGRPADGLDDQEDRLDGYRSPMHGGRPEINRAATTEEELTHLIRQIRRWQDADVEPRAIGVAARAGWLVKRVREELTKNGVSNAPLDAPREADGVRVGTMHGMKGLEFRCVAVVGAGANALPAPAALSAAGDDPIIKAQAIQRERCLLFVACTRARDHLYVSHTDSPSPFVP